MLVKGTTGVKGPRNETVQHHYTRQIDTTGYQCIFIERYVDLGYYM